MKPKSNQNKIKPKNPVRMKNVDWSQKWTRSLLLHSQFHEEQQHTLSKWFIIFLRFLLFFSARPVFCLPIFLSRYFRIFLFIFVLRPSEQYNNRRNGWHNVLVKRTRWNQPRNVLYHLANETILTMLFRRLWTQTSCLLLLFRFVIRIHVSDEHLWNILKPDRCCVLMYG